MKRPWRTSTIAFMCMALAVLKHAYFGCEGGLVRADEHGWVTPVG